MLRIFLIMMVALGLAEAMEALLIRVWLRKDGVPVGQPRVGWLLVIAGFLLLAFITILGELALWGGATFILVGAFRVYQSRHAKSVTDWRNEIYNWRW